MKLHRIFSTAIISLMFSILSLSTLAASISKVDFVIGKVTATSSQGIERILNKGNELNANEVIQTNDNSKIHLSFSDGGRIALQENTTFKVEEYQFTGKEDGSEKAFFNLAKGTLRSITGIIGHVNKKNYHINTPLATIGIRGTEFLVHVKDKLNVHVAKGAVYITNKGGEITLTQGQSASVSDINSKPQIISNLDTSPNNNIKENASKVIEDQYRSGNDLNKDGGPSALPQSGSGGGTVPICFTCTVI
jgi:hypothetical protein